MKDFRWTQSLSVGNADIDVDHKGLFALIRDLEDTDKTHGYLAEVLAKLENCANEHFAREEQLMRQIGFPGYDDHLKEHRQFVEWLDSVKVTYRRAAERPFLIGDLVIGYLKQWLTGHIMHEDMKYRDFLLQTRQVNGFFNEDY